MVIQASNNVYIRRGFDLKSSAMANRTLPNITIRDYSPADVGYAKVRLTVNHTDTSRQDKAKVFEAICSALDHKAMMVKGSWAVVDSNPTFDVLVGMVSVNKESVVYTDQNASKFRMISSNMFMDDEKSMWALTETEGGKIMVRTTAYDDDKVLDELLKSLSSASTQAVKHNGIYDTFRASASNMPKTDSFCNENAHLVEGGCYAVYASKASAQHSGMPGVNTGFIVSTVNDSTNRATDSVIVLGRVADTYEVIHRNMLLTLCSAEPDVVDNNDTTLNATAASKLGSSVGLEEILAYYRQLYSRNPDYFAKFEERLMSHFYA